MAWPTSAPGCARHGRSRSPGSCTHRPRSRRVSPPLPTLPAAGSAPRELAGVAARTIELRMLIVARQPQRSTMSSAAAAPPSPSPARPACTHLTQEVLPSQRRLASAQKAPVTPSRGPWLPLSPSSSRRIPSSLSFSASPPRRGRASLLPHGCGAFHVGYPLALAAGPANCPRCHARSAQILGSRSVYLCATPAQTEKMSWTSMAGRHCWTWTSPGSTSASPSKSRSTWARVRGVYCW